MATSTYLSLLKIVSGYVDETKARQIIARQMAKCNATEATLEMEQLKTMAQMVAGAAGLYVSEPSRRMELARRVSALAGL